MTTTRLKRQIHDALQGWKKEFDNPDINGMPGYMEGILRGYREALKIVQSYQKEEIGKTRASRRRLTSWSAFELYRACEKAYKYLCDNDRKAAMAVLLKVLTEIRAHESASLKRSGDY